MMLWTKAAVIAVLVATTTACTTKCPSPWFDVTFGAVIDQVLPASTPFSLPDPNFEFYTDVLGYTQSEIDDVIQDALDFFDAKFGLDFSQSQPDANGCRPLNNSLLCPFFVNPIVHYEITESKWLKKGKIGTKCYENRDGAFIVSFSGPEMLHGTYGGAAGKQANIGDTLAYGFYAIFNRPNNPTVIHFESSTPLRPEPEDGFFVLNCAISHPTLGEGFARGIISVFPMEDPNFIHYTLRSFFAFPKHA